MAEVLDQSEVDALLAAVGSGDVGAAPAGGSEWAPAHASDKPVHDYDFKRPERVSKDQLRSLEAIHEGFARNLGASLSGLLRTIIEIQVASIEQLTYSEFIRSLPNPTCFNLLEADGLNGQLCLELSPLIIYPIIDRLLGGSTGELFVPQRPLTVIEQRLVGRLTDRALATLGESWSAVVPVTFRNAATESNPVLVQIVPPNEVVVIVVFEIKMGARSGNMSLCIPFNVIEPLMGRLATQNWFSYRRREPDPAHRSRVQGNVRNAPVQMRAFLAQTVITVGDLIGLEPGDVIKTAKDAGGEIIVQVEGVNKFAGRMGQFRGRRAVKITRKAGPDESL
ncbi:MAG: Flagellar motor switch protein FliM [Phycisphaerae bacterium]|nr:Flagellar motor switch protein FliM [Phycisphaerae bacterium]